MPKLPRLHKNAPAGTLWFGGPIRWFSVSLSVSADDLDPDKITRVLGIEPDIARPGGSSPKGGQRKSLQGLWSYRLRRHEAAESDVEEAIECILRIADVPSWDRIVRSAEARIFVGLSLDTYNRGFRLSSEILRRVADKRIQLDFDIYAEHLRQETKRVPTRTSSSAGRRRLRSE